jgi:hypothetical protein
MTLLACCDRSARLAGDANNPWSAELERLLGTSDRTRTLASGVDVTMPPSVLLPPAATPAPTAGITNTDLDRLRRDISSTASGTRNRAIDALRQADTPDAITVLLTALDERACGRQPPDVAASCNILRALESMRQDIRLLTLVRLIPRCGMPAVAYQISRTLERKSGIAASVGAGLIPLQNTPEQQREAAAWWTTQLSRAATSPNPGGTSTRAPLLNPSATPGELFRRVPPQTTSQPGTGSATQGGTSTSPATPWQPDPLPLQLLAVSEHYVQQMKEVLRWYRCDSASPAATQPSSSGSIRAGPNSGDALLLALEENLPELSRLVRQHKDAAAWAAKADDILQRAGVRTLASENVLQKVAVNIDTQGRLLDLLIQEVDPQGKRKADREKARANWQTAQGESANVFYEIRDGCRYNLALWDLLLEGDR